MVTHMEHIDELTQVKRRAKSLGLSISTCAVNSGVYPAQISRWLSGATIPKITTFRAAMRKMQLYLDQVEQERKGAA